MPAMDIDFGKNGLGGKRSSPMEISSPRMIAQDIAVEETSAQVPKLNHEAIREKARKRKKNKKKGMPPAAPAVNLIKGFQTPVTSGGEESDASMLNTPRIGAMKDAPSPALRPLTPGGGISALRARLDALALESDDSRPGLSRVMTNTSICSMTPSSRGSDGDKTEMETYDVPLDQDFISSDAGTRTPLFASQAIEGGLRTETIHRKMCAEDFEQMRCLGKGAFGTVHLVKQAATGRLYAQKQFKKASITVHKRLIEQTRTERTILESVNRHPFVVKLYYAFQDQEKLYLILEYAQGGELFHHLAMERMFTEEVAAFYMAEMVLALEHLHQNVRVIYRDLKPENCLLDTEGHLLLTDFGLSKVALDGEDERTNSILGTIEYMAPEVIEGKAYDFSVDWWGLGAIGFDLLTGSPPFGGNNHTKIQQNIVKAKLQLPYFLGPDAKDLLTRLLRKEPHKRLGGTTAKDVKALKAHRFFRKIDWKALERRECEPPIQPVITDPELAENFSQEFTDLPMSPVVTRGSLAFENIISDPFAAEESNPFGGFSFVASRSLLDGDEFMLDA
ncbi:serine/threonine protein kinase [Zymoseptoria brevis]|uniref:Serine/threonine protein kinase n=1 Tax=Zymoseptoria brevis TaxID=1047168 RepID=A0A0F4GE21_9PEZI|nr:serine/threonine protein kinase [Zymoseptoria brevis]